MSGKGPIQRLKVRNAILGERVHERRIDRRCGWLSRLWGAAFALLVLMADAGAPEPSEIRIEVSDDLRGPR
jgi:hypothetical protein